MKINQIDKGGLVVLQIEGEISGTWANNLKELLSDYDNKIGYSNIILDIGKVSFIDSLGAEVIKDAIKNKLNIVNNKIGNVKNSM